MNIHIQLQIRGYFESRQLGKMDTVLLLRKAIKSDKREVAAEVWRWRWSIQILAF